MRNTRTLVLVEVALAIALATVLNLAQLRLPINFAGGSVNLSMLPIALVALRRGLVAGGAAGLAFGCIDLLLEPYVLVPIQVVLDYPLPYLLFGLGVGLFSPLYNKFANRSAQGITPGSAQDAAQDASQGAAPGSAQGAARGSASRLILNGSLIIIVALMCGGVLRYIPHVLSGVFFFAEYATDFFAENPTLLAAGPVDAGLNAWVYSLVYNLTYLVPSLVSIGIATLVIAPVLAKAVPAKAAPAKP